MTRTNGYTPILWPLIAGLLLLLLEAGKEVTCLRGSAVVLQAKAKAAELEKAGTVEGALVTDAENNGNGTASNSTSASTNSTQSQKKSLLTGIPQKDYIFDPNLPRELNGHNLSSYPFYNAVPEDIDFNCDGLHDGFYASVPHKCQVYHHCLFGTRYDFLCANYTAFDQKTFICHFVSEVDCVNSPKYFKRNEALYKAATSAPTTTTSTARPTSTSAPPQPPPPPPPLPPRRLQGQGSPRNRHRRPYRRRRPVYEYYYDDEYDDSEYYDDDILPAPPRRKTNRKHRPQGGALRDDEVDFESQPQQSSTDMVKPSVRPNSPSAASVYDRPRVPPKIRRPVPINERDKYDYTQKTSDIAPSPTVETNKESRNQPTRKQPTEDDDYYDDDYEEEQPKYKKVKQSDYDTAPTGSGESRRSPNRHRLRLQNRKRPDRYEEDEDDYDLPQEDRPRSRKGQRFDDYTPRSSRPRGNRGKGYLRDDEAVPAERPGYISGSRVGSTSASNRKRPQNTEYTRTSSRKHQERRPLYDDEDEDDEYYDDEEEVVEEEKLPRKNHKPANRYSGRRDDDYPEGSRNGRRQNGKIPPSASGSNPSKPLSTERIADKTKNVENENAKPYKQSEKSSDEKSDFSHRQTSNKNSENHKISGGSNKNSASDNQNQYSGERDVNDEEYEDDYEDSKPITNTKPTGNGNERSDNVRQNSFSKSRTGVTNDQTGKSDENASWTSGEDSAKTNNYYKSTTTPSTQEQTNAYSRNPSIYRSRTSATQTTENAQTTTTTTSAPQHRFSSTPNYRDDNQDRDFSQSYRYKADSRNRTSQTSSVNNNYKKVVGTTTAPLDQLDKSEGSLKDDRLFKETVYSNNDDSSEKPSRDTNLDSSEISGPSRPVVSVGLFRRPLKSTTTNVIPVETTTFVSDSTPVSPQKPPSAIGYRRIVKPVEFDDKNQRKEPVPPTGFGGGFRRPNKPTESQGSESSTEDETFQKNSQQSSRSGNNQYRKLVKLGENTSVENSYVNKNNENESKMIQPPPSAPGSNYKRPLITSRPVVEDYQAEYDDSPKASQFPPSAPNSNYRRPSKTSKVQENQSTENLQDFNLGLTTVPPSNPGGFRRPIEVPIKNEGSTIINLRSHYGFFNPDKPKQTGNDNSPTGPDSTAYPRIPPKNIIDKTDAGTFSHQPPRNVDITAPGPSAPDHINQNTKNSFRPSDFQNAPSPPSGSNLDIADEEYDVTLNDALQPSTLHPTRSLADYSQGRVKTRGFLSTVSHPTGFTNGRGAASPFVLSTSSSQQYLSRVQNIQPQEMLPGNTESKNQNKDSQASAIEEGYEAVVLSARPFDNGNLQRWVSQRQSRPTEWYW